MPSVSEKKEVPNLTVVTLPPSNNNNGKVPKDDEVKEAAVEEGENVAAAASPVLGVKRPTRDEIETILDQFGVAPSTTGPSTAKKRRAEAAPGSTEITFRAPITREILNGLEDNLVFFLETFSERIERYKGLSDTCTAYFNNHIEAVQHWNDGTIKPKEKQTVKLSKFSVAALRVRRPRIRLIRDWFLEDETHVPRTQLPADYNPPADEEEEGDDDDGAYESSESSLLDIASDCDFPETPFGETGTEADIPEPTSPSMAPLPTFGTGPVLPPFPTHRAGTAPIVGSAEDAIANRMIRSIKGLPSDFTTLIRFIDIVQAEALELNTLLVNIRDWVFLSLYAPDDVLNGSKDAKSNSSPGSKGHFSTTMSRLTKKKSSGSSASVAVGMRTEMQIEIAQSITEVLENRAENLDSLCQFKTAFLENRRNCLRAYSKFPHIPSYAQAFLTSEDDAWRFAVDSFNALRRVCSTSFSLVGRNMDSLRPCGGTKNKNSRRHALTSIYS